MFRSLFIFGLVSMSILAAQAGIINVTGNDILTGNRPTNLIANGSFESATGPNGGYWANGTSLTPAVTLTSWLTSGQVGTYAFWGNDGLGGINGSAPLPHGADGLYFGGGIMGGVSTPPIYAPNGLVTFASAPTFFPKPTSAPVQLWQTVSGLTPGGIYNLDFWTSGELVGSGQFAGDGFFGLDISGESTLYFAAPSGMTALGGSQRYHVKFTATAASLTFQWTNWGHWISPTGLTDELVLDDVILNRAVPEPSSWLALGAAMGLFGVRVRAKRKS